jgi:hypothetical protein
MNKKSTQKKRPVVARKVEPVVRPSYDSLFRFYILTAPFLRRLIEPRFDSDETNDYICGSSDCKNAVSALKEIE